MSRNEKGEFEVKGDVSDCGVLRAVGTDTGCHGGDSGSVRGLLQLHLRQLGHLQQNHRRYLFTKAVLHAVVSLTEKDNGIKKSHAVLLLQI